MREEEKNYTDMRDILNEINVSMDLISSIIMILAENYFCIRPESIERKKEWGVYSYTAVKVMFEVISEYTSKCYYNFGKIKEELELHCTNKTGYHD